MGPPLRLWRGIGRQFGRRQSSSLVCHSSPAGILLPCGGTSSQGKVDGLDTDCSVTGADRRFKRANCPQALPANLLGASTSSPPLRNDAAHDRPAGCPRGLRVAPRLAPYERGEAPRGALPGPLGAFSRTGPPFRVAHHEPQPPPSPRRDERHDDECYDEDGHSSRGRRARAGPPLTDRRALGGVVSADL
jgi:hypothetical protein